MLLFKNALKLVTNYGASSNNTLTCVNLNLHVFHPFFYQKICINIQHAPKYKYMVTYIK